MFLAEYIWLRLPSATYFFIRKKVSKILGEKNALRRAAPAPTFFALPCPLLMMREALCYLSGN